MKRISLLRIVYQKLKFSLCKGFLIKFQISILKSAGYKSLIFVSRCLNLQIKTFWKDTTPLHTIRDLNFLCSDFLVSKYVRYLIFKFFQQLNTLNFYVLQFLFNCLNLLIEIPRSTKENAFWYLQF